MQIDVDITYIGIGAYIILNNYIFYKTCKKSL